MSFAVGGRPGLRFLLPSYLAAMRWRYPHNRRPRENGRRRDGGGWVRSSVETGQRPWSKGALLPHNSFVNKRGRGEMTKSPITLQELRRRIYVKAMDVRDCRTVHMARRPEVRARAKETLINATHVFNEEVKPPCQGSLAGRTARHRAREGQTQAVCPEAAERVPQGTRRRIDVVLLARQYRSWTRAASLRFPRLQRTRGDKKYRA